MPLAISSSPTIDNFLYSDVPLTMSLTAEAYPFDKPLWDSGEGSFDNYLTENPVFNVDDRTQTATIWAWRVAQMYILGDDSWNLSTNVTSTSPDAGTVTKSGGSGGTWDARAFSTARYGISSTNALLDFRAGETDKDKAGGFTDDVTGAELNPDNSGFRFAWWLKADGTAMPYHVGVALLSSSVEYTTDTRFRLNKIGSFVHYYMDGVEVASVAVGGSFDYYPLLTFQDSGASIKSAMFVGDTTTTYQDSLEISVVGVFPEQPQWAYELNKDVNTLISMAEDGTATFRVKGQIKRTMSLQFVERPFDEYVAISDFWDWHRKHIQFAYRDIPFEDVYLCVFDSGLKVQPVGPDRVSMSLVVREY